ncbi:PfkB family carbohydrate kinase [uncultured Roseobacter sp.]|uniref:PfkB family carbohydrate kinase n=1 Tax=uncultured Roseobacter sp. TaxID=114847 RepID=UPI002625EE57|nr:PfkB family carbohydrate kinase [uncultured Roseobacter sp.]
MSLLVVGALHLDVVLRAPHLPGLDETVTGSAVDYVFGGKGGNQAVAAARLGAKVEFAGRTGADGFGAALRATLTESGVETRQLQDDPGPSGMSAAIVDAQGEYGAVIVSAANLNIDAARIHVPEGTALVLLQNEIPEEVNLTVARSAKAAGARVWLNAGPARPLPPALTDALDLLIVNRVEAAAYSDLAVPKLETRGADGVVFEDVLAPGYAVDVISTHGAGDVFVGALAADVTRGVRIADAIPFAQAAAALHVSMAPEARAQLSRAAVTAFLQDHSSR